MFVRVPHTVCADAHGVGHGERFARQLSSGSADPANGIRQFTAGTGGQCVVADDTPITDDHERPRRTGTLVRQCSPLQPVVQPSNGAVEE